VRVAFDARLLDSPRLRDSGIGRYASCLLEALERRGAGAVELVRLRGLRRPPAPARVAEGLEHLLLGRDVRRTGAAVLHSPSLEGVSLRPGAALVVTLHDLVPLKQAERYLRTGLKHRLRYAAVRRAARVIVPSRAVARDTERLLGVHASRVAVVPEAAAEVFRPVADPRSRLERLELPERYLLWVGRLDPPDPRKGVEELARAVRARDGLPLVLAGPGPAAPGRLAAPGRVWAIGRVSDAELAALYTAAEALVFPSSDEGYGLPPVEALACGTPVAAYAAGSLPELLEQADGAALVPPGDPAALLEAAEGLAGRRARPPARTWADVAAETEAVYLAAGTARGPA
jgi:glycosyltransferase involved in cell wall biosynthesis